MDDVEETSLTIVEEPTSDMEAIESLLMLGSTELQRSHSTPLVTSRRPCELSSWQRRFSSCSSEPCSVAILKEKPVESLYQRMRERNNEASKRCRLKRRLKAENLEQQCSALASINEHLKERMMELEALKNVLEVAIKDLEEKNPSRVSAVSSNEAFKALADFNPTLSLSELLERSRREREETKEEMEHDSKMSKMAVGQTSSEDETMTSSYVSGPSNVSMMVDNISPCRKTAATLINRANSPFPGRSTQLSITAVSKPMSSSSSTLLSASASTSHPIILLSPATPTSTTASFALPKQEIEIKCEPDIQIECFTHQPPTSSSFDWCAASSPSSVCEGNRVDVEMLNASVDLEVMSGSKLDDGHKVKRSHVALEKVVLRSALQKPFWKPTTSEDPPLYLCEAHYSQLLHPPQGLCTVCRKAFSANCTVPITYRMSLESYTRTGRTWPIGSPICKPCNEKHFTGPNNSSMMSNRVLVHPVPRQAHKRTSESPSALSTAANSSMGNTPGSIYAKIGLLNDSLCSINPSYKPLGFTINSIESCSQSVLSDAVEATETGIATLLSVIAPGQEAHLWKVVQPRLNDRFRPSNE